MRGINSGNMIPSLMATVKALIFIVGFAPALCGLAQSGVESLTGDCSDKSTGTEEVNVESPNTTLTLKCTTGQESKVTPALSTPPQFKVCTQKDCKKQQLLSEYIQGAKAEKIVGADVTVKITDLPSTEKKFYVRCGEEELNSCSIQVNVAEALSNPGVESLTGDCSDKSTGTEEVNVESPNTTLTLKCTTGQESKVTPALSTPQQFKVCTQKDCKNQQLLSEYIQGAKAEKIVGADVTVKITDLPSTEKKFYVRCGKEELNSCSIQVNVAKALSNPGGVTPGSPLSCAKGGGAITIKIPEKGFTAQFTCGSLTLYPRATDRVFGEDCKKEESLKDIVRSVDDNVYTLTAGKKPPKKKWCYLCASSEVTSSPPGKPSDYCLVHVESSSRRQSSSAIQLAAMLPCVLAMLRIT